MVYHEVEVGNREFTFGAESGTTSCGPVTLLVGSPSLMARQLG